MQLMMNDHSMKEYAHNSLHLIIRMKQDSIIHSSFYVLSIF